MDETLTVSVRHSFLKKLFAGGLALFLVSLVAGWLMLVVQYSPLGPFGELGILVMSIPSWYFLYLKLFAIKVIVSL